MTYLLSLLFFVVAAEDDRAKAVEAARARYDKLVIEAERNLLTEEIRAKKQALADIKRAAIDPGVPGQTSVMKDRGDGVFVSAGMQFPTAEAKRSAESRAGEELKKAEANLDLWKNGLTHPSVTLPPIEFDRASVGQVGTIRAFEVLSVSDHQTALVRVSSRIADRFDAAPVIMFGFPTVALKRDQVIALGDAFWVSGKRTVGKQSVFVVEPVRE